MNFLADEGCAGPVIRALRKAGHDVIAIAIAEVAAGATDQQVLDRALNENRVLITEDRDFGNLVYAQRRPSAGVVLLRFSTSARHSPEHPAKRKLFSLLFPAILTVHHPGRRNVRPSKNLLRRV